jgi:hypothetical protein
MENQISLVYIHIGINLPKYIYDSLYQTLLISEYKVKIYIIIDDSLIETFNNEISKFNHDIYFKSEYLFQNIIQLIPLSLLDMKLNENTNFNNYKNVITNKFSNLGEFRNGFWVSTTARFYYIGSLMEMFNLKNVFHIENDIMLYESPNDIYNYICRYLKETKIDKICMIQDAPNRTIPSLLYFPDSQHLSELTKYITNELEFSSSFINDMNILGTFPDKYALPILPNQITKQTKQLDKKNIIFDGAAIGQYLGGVDYKNLPNYEKDKLIEYDNPSRGFINETSIIKADKFIFSNTQVALDHLNIPIKIKTCREIENSDVYEIANLHIHSKQLYQFSSIFDIQYKDIITGDRVLSLCDFVLLTKDIYNFHSGINKYAKDIILIKNFNDINLNLLNKYFLEHCNLKRVKTVKLFIYTHILEPFTKFILPFLDDTIQYILYLHNSDHSFNEDYKNILESLKIKKVYSQNIDFDSDTNTTISNKLHFLPIGIANSMWAHGNLEELYTVMQETYKNTKVNSVYVNINPNTYDYRKKVLDKIIYKSNFNVSSNKPYIEYLRELASHRFSLCIRGNGLDTHRFWESLYLGVIPIIINNKTTKCKNFVKYVHKLNIPFYEIINDNLDIMFTKYTNTYFNETLYKNILNKCKASIFNLDSLKLSYYN